MADEHASGPGWFEPVIIGVVIIGIAAYILSPVLRSGFDSADQLVNADVLGSAGVAAAAWWHQWVVPSFVIIDIILFALIIYCGVKSWHTFPKVSMFETPSVAAVKRKLKKDKTILLHWNNLVARFRTGTPENMRLAIIEADTLVDYFLKQAEYAGETMADRLSNIQPGELKSLERVWKAHRLRNDLVHTPGFSISQQEAHNSLQAFRDFLMELDAF
jgi:hypothetical protein